MLSLYACSGENRIKIENLSGGNQKITIQRGGDTTPVMEIRYDGERTGLDFFTRFVDRSLICFYKYMGDKNRNVTYRIPYDSDYYRLFYSIGLHLLSGWKNELFKYGVIELEWRNLLSGFKNEPFFSDKEIKSQYGKYFRIQDIDDVMVKHIMKPDDAVMINPYAVNFLLKEISFISIQEFFSRQDRYYSPGDLDSVFTRMTVIPESSEFTRFVLNKFGRERLLNLASIEFSNETWLNLTDEKINETESSFSKSIENYNFTGVFKNTDFTNELYGILKIYNKNTKKTLFRK